MADPGVKGGWAGGMWGVEGLGPSAVCPASPSRMSRMCGWVVALHTVALGHWGKRCGGFLLFPTESSMIMSKKFIKHCQLFIAESKRLDKKNLEEREFILAHVTEVQSMMC